MQIERYLRKFVRWKNKKNKTRERTELTTTLKTLTGLYHLDETQFDYLFHQTATR